HARSHANRTLLFRAGDRTAIRNVSRSTVSATQIKRTQSSVVKRQQEKSDVRSDYSDECTSRYICNSDNCYPGRHWMWWWKWRREQFRQRWRLQQRRQQQWRSLRWQRWGQWRKHPLTDLEARARSLPRLPRRTDALLLRAGCARRRRAGPRFQLQS